MLCLDVGVMGNESWIWCASVSMQGNQKHKYIVPSGDAGATELDWRVKKLDDGIDSVNKLVDYIRQTIPLPAGMYGLVGTSHQVSTLNIP